MLSFYYQLQVKRNGRWFPYFPYKSDKPLESTDLSSIMSYASELRSRYENLRLVKIETYSIPIIDYYGNPYEII